MVHARRNRMTEKEKLIQMILENEDIKRYKRIEKIINDNKDLKSKIGDLKSIQKQLVNAKEINKTEAIKTFEARYQERLEEIESYPLMSDYLALQSDINEMLQAIQDILQNGIESDFEKD
jgi:cell fate (sporulation/competence/biofilm development) regulator YmcA (YheA/YmcA/DUF963 family)